MLLVPVLPAGALWLGGARKALARDDVYCSDVDLTEPSDAEGHASPPSACLGMCGAQCRAVQMVRMSPWTVS